MLITTSCGLSYNSKETTPKAIQPRSSLSYDTSTRNLGEEQTKVLNATKTETSTIERKIIKNANLRLELKDLSNISKKVNQIIKSHQGFIANSHKWNGHNNQKIYNFTLRIPENKFETALVELSDLGKLVEEELNSRDITKEYIDLEARLKNFKAQEKRYLDLLNQAKNVKDILEIERELNRVRTNIEQMEGTLKYYDNQINLATIRLKVSQPEPIIDNNSNWGILNSFKESLRNFIHNINLIIILVGGLIPWLLILSIISYLVYRIIKKR
ncbi:DUF4349 domain-containing protein [Orenia marismortui]|uniref:Uncharacterized protein DUF4349 n=1 Tax=Orenia marismortui TaxID=46469 RepID=A0A4R8H0F2_9FIRM|nr:DUF4349 domain-containing protein [Orenia marismortui]TDX52678.1 uncharacterized protein DUF4349 [Orenia marismortui]